MMNERPQERDSTQGFGRGSTQGSFGRGNGRGFYSQGPLERNERYSQVEELSDPASEGRRRSDAHIYSPTTHSRHQRTPPNPALSEDRLFTDWSSVGSRSLPVVPTSHREPIEGTPIALGVENICEAERAAPQPSQHILMGSHIDTTGCAVQEDFSPTQNVFWHTSRKTN